jgi:hypothetical protein
LKGRESRYPTKGEKNKIRLKEKKSNNSPAPLYMYDNFYINLAPK